MTQHVYKKYYKLNLILIYFKGGLCIGPNNNNCTNCVSTSRFLENNACKTNT